jgi:cytochrome c553
LASATPPGPRTKAGDAVAGDKKAQMCSGCHNIPGYQASFPEVYKVPKIAGQNAKYIASALAAYRKGERKHPTMRAIAGSLSDQDIADLAASTPSSARAPARRPRRRRPAPPPGAPTQRRPPSPSCSPRPIALRATAPTSRRPIDPSYPKLAGQYADYLYYALKAYQVDHNPLMGRGKRDHDGHGTAVHASRDQGDRRLPELAARRIADSRTVALQIARSAKRGRPDRSAAELAEHRGEAPRR